MVAQPRSAALLERDTPLDALASALAEAATGQGRVALVYGEAGIGKTSLVDHFTRARKAAVRTLWGACDSLHTRGHSGRCTTSPPTPARVSWRASTLGRRRAISSPPCWRSSVGARLWSRCSKTSTGRTRPRSTWSSSSGGASGRCPPCSC